MTFDAQNNLEEFAALGSLRDAITDVIMAKVKRVALSELHFWTQALRQAQDELRAQEQKSKSE